MREKKEYEFYNNELKNRYIDYKEETTILANGFAQRIFDSVKKFEEDLRKDVSCFTYYEICDMYKAWNEVSLSVLSTKNSFLCGYTQWCLLQNLVLDSQNHFEEFNTTVLMDCLNVMLKNKQIMDRNQVVNLARSLRNPCDGFLILGLFEGIYGKGFSEFYDLRITDFLETDKGIFVSLNSGRTIQVSNELYNLALNANDEDKYYGVSEDVTYKFVPSNTIMKDFPNTVNPKANFNQRMASKIRRNKNEKDFKYISSNTLKESGKIDFINRKAAEKQITAKQYLFEYYGEVEYQFDCNIPARTTFYNKYEAYLI